LIRSEGAHQKKGEGVRVEGPSWLNKPTEHLVLKKKKRESKNYVAVLEFPTKEGERNRVLEREKKRAFFEGSAHDCFSIPMLFSSFCILHTLRRAAARKKDKRVRRCAQGKCVCVCVCERERERARV